MLLPKCVFNYNIIDKSNGSVHAGITVFKIAIQNNWEKKNYNSSLWNQLLTTIFLNSYNLQIWCSLQKLVDKNIIKHKLLQCLIPYNFSVLEQGNFSTLSIFGIPHVKY